MEKQSTCLNCIVYPEEHNGTVFLTYVARTKQLALKEIDMLGSLKYPCIVQLLGAFVDSDSLMLVMEKMQQDLANFLSITPRDILVKVLFCTPIQFWTKQLQ